MELILIRHTSVAVPPGTCYGQTDVPVADSFEEEAAATRTELEKYGAFDAVYSSPLTRARVLAAACGYEQPVLDDRLMEISMGNWEMRRFDEIVDPHLQEWYERYLTERTSGGESFQDVYRRVASFLDELKQTDYRRVAVFAHGGVLLSAGIYAGLFTTDDMWNHVTPHGGILPLTLHTPHDTLNT